MKKIVLAFILLVIVIPVVSQVLSFTTCTNCWNPDSLGNHRW
ncbi:MAG TPA: hypothetical protein VIJ92_03595 [Ginsengibacter sp.]